MKNYIYMISAASVISGTAILLSGNTKMQKPLKYLASLIMLLMLISPFADIKASFADINGIATSTAAESIYTAAADATYNEACRLAEQYICDSIYAEFGIKPTSCRIFFDSESGTGKCVVTVDGVCDDAKSIETYITALSGTKTEVISN